MKQLIVGTYYAGHEQAELVLREGDGGECYISPENGKVARIKIGAEQSAWWKIVAVLLHETMELVQIRKGGRYQPCGSTSGDHSAYLFVFDHTAFSDVCAKTADYMAAALPDLFRAWNAWRKAERLNAKARAGRAPRRKLKAKK